MLSDEVLDELRAHFELMRRPITIQLSISSDDLSQKMFSFIEIVSQCSDKIRLCTGGRAGRVPSFAIVPEGAERLPVQFAGLPLGLEFSSFALAVLWAGGHPPKVPESVLEGVRAFDGTLEIEVYYSPACQPCLQTVQAAILFAYNHANVTTTLIEAGEYSQEIKDRHVRGLPSTFINGDHLADGGLSLTNMLSLLKNRSTARGARARNELTVFGSSPGAASAAVCWVKEQITRDFVRHAFQALAPGGDLMVVNEARTWPVEDPEGKMDPERQHAEAVRLFESEGFMSAAAETPFATELQPGARSALDAALEGKRDHLTLCFNKPKHLGRADAQGNALDASAPNANKSTDQ